MEAKAMIDMINQHVIPSLRAAGGGKVSELEAVVTALKKDLHEIHEAEASYEKAKLARVLRLETMVKFREVCDRAESIVPSNLWTLATYKELLFLDSHMSM